MNIIQRYNSGETFGNLTIVECLGLLKGHTSYKLRCKCGNTIVRSETYLLSAEVFCCGHSCAYMHDITGMTFFNWTVVEPKKFDSAPRTRWLCKCKCGNESYIDYHTLKKGLSKSCGCLGILNKRKFRYPTNKTLTAMKSRCFNKKNTETCFLCFWRR